MFIRLVVCLVWVGYSVVSSPHPSPTSHIEINPVARRQPTKSSETFGELEIPLEWIELSRRH